MELRVVESRLYVERDGQRIEHTLISRVVIVFHVEEQRLFVTHVIIVLQFVVDSRWVLV